MGGPSAAIVVQELAELGVRRAIRVGTCGALAEDLGHGDLVVVGAALAGDGTSRALGSGETAEPDPELTARLASAVGGSAVPALIATTDLFYETGPGDDGVPAPRAETWRGRGVAAVEMEAATLFTLGKTLGVATGCVLTVSDTFPGGLRRRIGDEELAAAAERMGAVASAALADQP